MCTLTFSPQAAGYLVAMNRDELLTRPAALPPDSFKIAGIRALYPREPSGGTWIACNNLGATLALLNWNAVRSGDSLSRQTSRGSLIPRLIFQARSAGTERSLASSDLSALLPFRLFGIFPHERKVFEWRWDGSALGVLLFPWRRHHWFSSSLSDALAQRSRGSICSASRPAEGRDHRDWLANLHRSHAPAPGPYSICVHRPDAATVSYTQIVCDSTSATLAYLSGSPCRKRQFDTVVRLPQAESPQVATTAPVNP